MRSTALAGFLAASCWLAPGLMLAQAGPRPEHPRPDFQRANWLSLNGSWDFRFDPEDAGIRERWWEPGRDFGARKISVPFCWESSLSGVNVKGGLKIGWYRRRFSIPAAWRGDHAWLRFDAVDWEARVWVNGKELGAHEGGYTPFEFDLAGAAEPGEEATVVVRAFDATDPELPRGKQTPEWYTYTSGIWQTVWLESRPARYISRFTLTARRAGERWFVDLAAEVGGAQGPAPLRVSSPEAGIEAREIGVEQGRARASLEVRNPKLWTPDAPHLYGLTLRLGEDAVETYFGLRTIGRGRYGDLPHESVLLNGEPVYLRGALDQSFNPLGIYTAPSDAFLRRDIELAKSAGLNLLRIHIKADEPRRLYWADRLGILLMQDMPSNSEHSPRSREAWENTMRAVIERDRNHPSIIAWVAFNETWGLTGKGIAPYAENRETQEWVLRMWKTMKESRSLPAGGGQLAGPARPCRDRPELVALLHRGLRQGPGAHRGGGRQDVPRLALQLCAGPGAGERAAHQLRVRRRGRRRGRPRRLLGLCIPHHRAAPVREDPGLRLHRADRYRVGAQRPVQLRPHAQGVRLRRLRAGHDRARSPGRRLHRVRGPVPDPGRRGIRDWIADLCQPLLEAHPDAGAALVGHRHGRPRRPGRYEATNAGGAMEPLPRDQAAGPGAAATGRTALRGRGGARAAR